MSRPYPPDAASRVAAREANRRRILAGAEVVARTDGFSINCARKLHAGTHPVGQPGCANHGDGCLCQCHDGPA